MSSVAERFTINPRRRMPLALQHPARRCQRRLARVDDEAPVHVQQAFDKQAMFLLENIRHPSLRVKKYDEASDIWQARVTRGWRFYFTIEGDTYHLHTIIPHPK